MIPTIKIKWILSYVAIFGIVFAGCIQLRPLSPIDRCKRILAVEDDREIGIAEAVRIFFFGRYDFSTEPFGVHTMIVHCTEKGWAPEIMQDFLVIDGKAVRMSTDSLGRAFQLDEPPAKDPVGQRRVIDRFLKLVDDHCQIIERPGNIPEYAKSPLPSQIEKKISPPRIEKQMGLDAKAGSFYTHMLYTYQPYGGEVRFYQFTFSMDGRLSNVHCAMLKNHIGKYYLLM